MYFEPGFLVSFCFHKFQIETSAEPETENPQNFYNMTCLSLLSQADISCISPHAGGGAAAGQVRLPPAPCRCDSGTALWCQSVICGGIAAVPGCVGGWWCKGLIRLALSLSTGGAPSALLHWELLVSRLRTPAQLPTCRACRILECVAGRAVVHQLWCRLLMVNFTAKWSDGIL